MRITPREHRYVAMLIAMLAGVTMPGSSSMAQSPTALTDPATGVALGTQPLTVALPPQPAMPRAFAEARRGNNVVALAIEGLEGAMTQPVRINVFIGKPDANRSTSTDDPHFIGTIALLPRNGRLKPTGRIFDLSNAAGLDTAAPLQVTLVPVVGTNSAPQAPRDAALRVGKIYIRTAN